MRNGDDNGGNSEDENADGDDNGDKHADEDVDGDDHGGDDEDVDGGGVDEDDDDDGTHAWVCVGNNWQSKINIVEGTEGKNEIVGS